MSPLGHNITAFTMAATYMGISDVPFAQGFSSLPALVIQQDITPINRYALVTLVALGMQLGARYPDRLEMPRFNKCTRTRHSVIPHRTLTHWPMFWLLITAACWIAWSECENVFFYGLTSVGLGFCASAWLHLLMDIMTPMGIPLAFPFGSRTSLNWYKTAMNGNITGEWVCIFLFAVIGLFFQCLSSGGLALFEKYG